MEQFHPVLVGHFIKEDFTVLYGTRLSLEPEFEEWRIEWTRFY